MRLWETGSGGVRKAAITKDDLEVQIRRRSTKHKSRISEDESDMHFDGVGYTAPLPHFLGLIKSDKFRETVEVVDAYLKARDREEAEKSKEKSKEKPKDGKKVDNSDDDDDSFFLTDSEEFETLKPGAKKRSGEVASEKKSQDAEAKKQKV